MSCRIQDDSTFKFEEKLAAAHYIPCMTAVTSHVSQLEPLILIGGRMVFFGNSFVGNGGRIHFILIFKPRPVRPRTLLAHHSRYLIYFDMTVLF